MGISDDLVTHLIQLVFGGGMLWLIRSTHQLVVGMARLQVTLFGEQGNNGMNGRIKKAEDDVAFAHRRIGHVHEQVAVIRQRLDGD